MLRAQPKPKERRKLSIPADLRDSLCKVWELIQQAEYDQDINLDFDDAIQVGSISGGRVRKRPRPFELNYYPRDDAKKGVWHLTLHECEIEDIADGRMTEISMYCCKSPDCRRRFREADACCGDCDYVTDPDYAHLPLQDALPRLEKMGVMALTPHATRDDVLAVLGPPQESGGGIPHGPRYIKPWIKYHRPDCQLRFECGETGRIESVTFMPKDWRPGR